VQRVFVDADVLFSACLRYWLFQFRISTPSMFQISTTEDVVAETISKLRDKYPRWDGRQTTRVREDIIEVFDEMVPDFDGSIDYSGKDPGDFHVHAAAVACKADILLTCDGALRNQPNADALPYEAYHPDDFFVLLNDSAPLDVRDAVLAQLRFHIRKYGANNTSMIDRLVAAGCPQFAEIVRVHLVDLAGQVSRSDRRRMRKNEQLTVEVGSRAGAQISSS
jgi:predicted nucleic acid-binding protein